MFKKKYSTEKDLVAGCVNNDRRAQEMLFRRFFPAMLGMCRRHTRDEDTAVELVNAGFLQVFLKMHTYAFKGSLEGWIRRVIYRCIADHYRKNARYAHFIIFEEKEIIEQQNAGLDACYEADILDAMSELPPASREVFRLYALEGYNHREIAEALQISEGTSKWHLSTARQILRAYLELNGYADYNNRTAQQS